MDGVWSGVAADLGALDAAGLLQALVRLLVAVLLCGLLGYDREQVGKEAGIRTYMLVGLGSALFVLGPRLAGVDAAHIGEVIQGVATGMGFVGAGTILKQEQQGRVQGLTTAAGLWLAAATGVTVGLGQLAAGAITAGLGYVIIALLRHFERRRASAGGRP
jgi:putative Mg2+ transporter-C (MgtC) family protein